MLFYVMLFLASLLVAILIVWFHGLAKRARQKAERAKKLRIHASQIPTVNGPGSYAGMSKSTALPEVAGIHVCQANTVLYSTWDGSIKREQRFQPREPEHGSLNSYLKRKREQERANNARKTQTAGVYRIDRAKSSSSPNLSNKAELYEDRGDN
jgi:hypothetical protein